MIFWSFYGQVGFNMVPNDAKFAQVGPKLAQVGSKLTTSSLKLVPVRLNWPQVGLRWGTYTKQMDFRPPTEATGAGDMG